MVSLAEAEALVAAGECRRSRTGGVRFNSIADGVSGPSGVQQDPGLTPLELLFRTWTPLFCSG